MQSVQLNRVIRLIRRTGEKVMVMDNESEEVMALMSLGSYEKMLSGSRAVEEMTEEELLDRINRDIAVWRANNKDEDLSENEEEPEREIFTKVAEKKPENVNVMETMKEIRVNPAVSKNFDLNINTENEESLKDVLNTEEEEKFYIEPVE